FVLFVIFFMPFVYLPRLKRLRGEFADNPDNSAGCVTVPKFRRAGRFPIAIHYTAECVEDSVLVGANHNVGSLSDGYRPLGVTAQRETWHPENCRFFLKAAGIRQHNCCGGFQIEEFQIAERRHSPDPVGHRKAEVTDLLFRAWVYREEHWYGL